MSATVRVTLLAAAVLIEGMPSLAAATSKPGDWAQYEEIVEFKELRVRRVVKVTITKVDPATGAVTKAVEADSSGDVGLLDSLGSSIDMARKLLDADPRQTPKEWTTTVTKDVKEYKQQVTVGGRSYSCAVVESNGTRGERAEWSRKLSICPDVAIFERVNGEVTDVNKGYPPTKFTRQLLDFGSGSDAPKAPSPK